MNSIQDRLQQLRSVMQRERLGAFIFPSTDPHNGEYVPARWKGREWISGFNGSAGVAVVTMTGAALWTDSRYFIAANEQLSDTEFVLMKQGLHSTPSIAEWICEQLSNNSITEVGIDGWVSSQDMIEGLTLELRNNGGLTLRTNLDILNFIWTDRPTVPKNTINLHSLEFAGEETSHKLQRIRQELTNNGVDGMLVTALDDIAWVLNLRGNDIPCNPVFVSYLVITQDDATLFIDEDKLNKEITNYLTHYNICTDKYENIVIYLNKYNNYNILLDPFVTPTTLFKAVGKTNIVRQSSPIPMMKAIKNEAEIKGIKSAMIKDGVALVKFLRWLKPAVAQGNETELSITKKLFELRSEQTGFKDISFDTIAGYKHHGAIVHYEADELSDIALKTEDFLLLDSGAQYIDGTTDITRTIPLGDITDEQRKIYTLVLKGHIDLELLKFPNLASGTQLDAVARMAMWNEGYNFLHGTGHGVGAYLNVHEGPHQIRMEYKPAPLQAGMTVTNEPGIYVEGKFGVRIENIMLISPYKKTVFGEFLQFESLTLCPIDTEPIIKDMLSKDEISWLNYYHNVVYTTLSPYLNNDEKMWLKDKTKEF